jgi:two-component system chemotaxis response regulator CheY
VTTLLQRLLVVDDSREIRRSVRRMLIGAGFEVDEAEDGLVALERLRESAYALVITDWVMPRLDGPGLLAVLQCWPERRSTPVLVITGGAFNEATLAGASDVLAKPFSTAQLIDRVEHALAHGAAEAAPDSAA